MKKVFAMLVALILALGCVSFAEVAEENANKIVIGTNAEFAPFEYFNEEGEIDGFDADLMEMIMTVLGYDFEIISIDFDALLPALESGRIDLSIAAMTITEERLENALFSAPYFNASQKIIVGVDSEVSTFSELNGKKIGVQMGTTGDLYVTENLPEATVERYNKALDAVIDLVAGRLDAVVTDAEPAKVYAAPYAELKILDENVSEEMYGIAAALGNEELIAQVDAALAAIIEGGYYDALYQMWFGEEEAEEVKKVVVGTNAEFAPFEYFNEAGEIDGFDADLIEMIMTALGYEFEIISIDFDALLPALESGRIDLAIAAMTITEERLENALFSAPYFNASQKIIVKADSEVSTFSELNGKKIGVQMGTTGDLYVTENLADATVERYNKALDAVIDLVAGRLDAVVTDAEPAKVYAAPYAELKILDENVSEEMYGIAAALGNEELIAAVDSALATIMEGGYYDALYEMWFGEE
ncbi:MAG: basic amino acid ABC transporter substrate-binding protein [Clostridia bacterium]|nr:basic amino acid ABC transporter substrate-binding protein [Clostridia bacterium]